MERFKSLHKIVDSPIFVECRRMGPFTDRIKDDGVVLDIMIHDIDIILNLIQSKVRQNPCIRGFGFFYKRRSCKCTA